MRTVTVLMSTYNGEKYLKMQIDSILAQKDVDVKLLVRDDGSKDSTQDILKEYAKDRKLTWYSGENLRSAKSFMDLIQKADDCEYYAFSDQDDFWLPNKLSSAVNILDKQNINQPALYYSVTTLVDEDLNKIEQHQESRKFIEFRYAVVSSNATGCTMCFNKALKDMINLYTPEYKIMHDGWLHKVCLAVGGYAFYDTNSYIYYRQHGNNVIGGTTTPLKRWKRRIKTILEKPCPRSRGVYELLKGYKDYMTIENQEICQQIISYRKSFFKRLQLCLNHNIGSTNKRIDNMYRISVLLGLF